MCLLTESFIVLEDLFFVCVFPTHFNLLLIPQQK